MQQSSERPLRGDLIVWSGEDKVVVGRALAFERRFAFFLCNLQWGCRHAPKGNHMVTYSVNGLSRREILKISVVLAGSGVFPSTGLGAAPPEGQLIWGVHVSLAPTWFDPAETPGTLIPFMVMYALHDAMVKPMPGRPLAPSLDESWNASEDAFTDEFVLRNGEKFHNGDDVTAEDVKFSFERYRGSAHHVLKDRVAAVETPDSRRVHFKLKQPWPDFLTFYGSATGAGWVVPKNYVER